MYYNNSHLVVEVWSLRAWRVCQVTLKSTASSRLGVSDTTLMTSLSASDTLKQHRKCKCKKSRAMGAHLRYSHCAHCFQLVVPVSSSLPHPRLSRQSRFASLILWCALTIGKVGVNPINYYTQQLSPFLHNQYKLHLDRRNSRLPRDRESPTR